MTIDCHCHIFTAQVIRNIVSKPMLVRGLHLDTGAAAKYLPDDLAKSARLNNVSRCILFPTASAGNVIAENDRYASIASSQPVLKTLATLHPEMPDIAAEARRMFGLGITGFKFCSFSQRFDVLSVKTDKMLRVVKDAADMTGRSFTIVIDTFTKADVHFGTPAGHLTTSGKLDTLVKSNPDIRFMATHMGGLAADFNEIRDALEPAPNLYLDTSNAAHTLAPDQFVALLKLHGADHILFGTDWPFFDHASEIPLIDSRLDKAGFSSEEKELVFHKNAEMIFFL